MLNSLTSTILSASLLLTPVNGASAPVAGQTGEMVAAAGVILSSVTMDLNNRYLAESISEGFKENILIALGYLALQVFVPESSDQGGEVLRQGLADFLPEGTNFSIILQPGEVFAFHQKGILPEFKDSKIITQESDFTTNNGYKVVAGLGGNGVCHLASLMNKAALLAGLQVTAPTNHNFASIPEIEREYGVSISTRNSPERQNLYIKNNFEFPVFFKFELSGNNLVFSVVK